MVVTVKTNFNHCPRIFFYNHAKCSPKLDAVTPMNVERQREKSRPGFNCFMKSSFKIVADC